MGSASARSWVFLACFVFLAAPTFAEISEDRVLILVNNASSTSHFVANTYRQYHPGIPEQNVVYLDGLPDITTTADEIVSRDDFETHIAEPVRQHLLTHDLVDHVWVIVTTAGMPYRIEDTTNPVVVDPHGGSVTAVQGHEHEVDASSVESELAVLWQIDPALEAVDPNCRAPLTGMIVNPYHGYVSPMASFCGDRDILGRRETFNFAAPRYDGKRIYEGQEIGSHRATGGREFCVKDMYLVARLDGPRSQSFLPDYYVSRMLEMAARVSDPNCVNFHGYDPAWTGILIDDKASGTVSDSNLWYNAGSALNLSTPPEAYLTSLEYPTPPNVSTSGLYRDDFRFAYRSLISSPNDTVPLPDPNDGMVIGLMGIGRIGGPVVYDPEDTLIGSDLDPNYGIGALCSFGVHQRDIPPTYLLDGGPGGTPLVHPVYGAIFNSTESFNAVTFFIDADIPPYAQQALIWHWIYIGGSGAVGHVFEPMAYAVADNDLLFFNYFRDDDNDGVGDMTFVEAAYSAIPQLSWANTIVGDPLMRIHQVYGAGPGWMEPPTCGSGALGGLAAGILLVGLTGLSRWMPGRRRPRNRFSRG